MHRPCRAGSADGRDGPIPCSLGAATTREISTTVGEGCGMSLSPLRTLAYTAGACTGGFTTAALVALRQRRPRVAGRWLGCALAAGAISVLCEEAASEAAGETS